MNITLEQATAWFANRLKDTPMPGARAMFEIAASAIREKAEREDPKPLTIEELLQMEGEQVWLNRSAPLAFTGWAEVNISISKENIWFWRFGNEAAILTKLSDYGKTWLAYRHKPKEVQKDA
jgi:uncharacterized protein (AIM24 family)